ncbi:unnamed protein product, partial [Linum tenue]
RHQPRNQRTSRHQDRVHVHQPISIAALSRVQPVHPLPGVPQLKWFGIVESDDRYYNVMVVELLCPNLGDLLNHCHKRFTLKTTLMLALQLLDRVQFVHSKGYLHRDIKPENIVMGLGRWAGRVYLIDYGLANRYRDLRDHRRHIYVEDKVGFAGTAIYASVSVHRGVEQNRKDDFESLGYVLVYFLRGGLPWQDLTRNGKTDWRYEKMGEMKVSISEESLREGLPYDFVAYFRYCRRELRFEDEPDYEYLKGMFRGLFVTEGFEFDWTVPRC